MHPDWKSFLQENCAVFKTIVLNDLEIDQLVSFGIPENEMKLSSQEALLSNPSERGLLKVSGTDAESFLQNQLTNDIRKVTETNHQESAWCSPKGRIIANFHIFKRNDDFYLALSRDLIEHVLKKLRMYIMMSKVVIENVSDSIIHFTFAAKQADNLMKDMLGVEITSDAETIQHNTMSLLRSTIPSNKTDLSTRFDIFVDDIDSAKTLWFKCKQHASPISGVGLRYLNIISAKPEITAASSEVWIPQMVNYIHINGVDFKKGCYPGQEVVARLNYLGKTKRRMYRLEIETNQLPEIGAVIKSDKDAEAGKILSAVVNSQAKVDALAVLKIVAATTPLTLAANDATITLLDLPYSVDDE